MFAGVVPVSPSRPAESMRMSSGSRPSSAMTLYLHFSERVLTPGGCQRDRAFAGLIAHRGGDVHVRPAGHERCRHHDEDPRRDRLPAELEPVHWRRHRTQLLDLLTRAEEERLARTDGCAHRLLANARAVVAHVALHHDLAILVDFRHAERTGDHTVPARDASRFARGLDDAVAGAFDRVGGTHFGTRRLLAVHADDGHGLHAVRAIDEFEVDHRFTAMRVALGTRLDARLTCNAAIRIDEEMQVLGLRHGPIAAARERRHTSGRFPLSARGSRTLCTAGSC